MNDIEKDENPDTSDNDQKDNFDILDFDDTEKKSIVKFFGLELVAPTGLKNAGLIYALFIVINGVIFFTLLKNQLSQ